LNAKSAEVDEDSRKRISVPSDLGVEFVTPAGFNAEIAEHAEPFK
jgi:hypothetical protein